MFERMTENARRRRVARDLEARMAELDRLDRTHGLGTWPPPPRAPRRNVGAGAAGLLVAGAVAVGAVLFSPNTDLEAGRRLLGLTPFGAGPDSADSTGPHTFMQTQPGSEAPVGYDPCAPIRVAVNPAGAPSRHEELVTNGLAAISEATGLTFERVGDTRARDVNFSGYGVVPPVLIMWADADEVPDLAGDVAGIGGSTAVNRGGMVRFVTGRVVLDTDVFDAYGRRDQHLAQAIVDHELAHLVGLGHVDDRHELMNAKNLGVTSFGPGDREGLARLGRISC